MKITVKQTACDLTFFPDTKIRIQENNPMFHDQGSFSFPFDLPLKENNRALNFPARLTKAGTAQLEFDVSIDSRILPDKEGILTITPSDTKIRASLLIGQGRFNYKMKNTRLRDVISGVFNIGPDPMDAIDHFQSAITKSWPDTPYNFPVIQANDDFYDGHNDDFGGRINYYELGIDDPSSIYDGFLPNLPNVLSSGNFTLQFISNFNAFIPFMYLSEIIKLVLSHFNYTVPYNVLSKFKHVLLWNNRPLDFLYKSLVIAESSSPLVIDDGVDLDTYPPIIFDIPLDQIYTDKYSLLDNSKWYPKSAGLYRFDFDFTFTQGYTPSEIIVKLLKNNTLDSSFSETLISESSPGTYSASIDINIYSDNVTNNDYFNLIVYCLVDDSSGDPLASDPNHLSTFVKIYPVKTTNEGSDSIDLKNHVPDIQTNDFLKHLSNLFGLFYFDDNGDVVTKLAKDIITSSPSLDLTDYVLSNHEITSHEFIKSFSFNSDVINIDDYDIIPPALTRSHIPVLYIDNKIILIRNTLQYYIAKYDSSYNITWSYFTDNLHKLELKDKGKNISSELYPLQVSDDKYVNNQPDSLYMFFYSDSGPGDRKTGIMPVAPDKAHSPTFNSIHEDMSLRVFNWLGQITSKDDSETYPAASCGSRDNQGDSLPNRFDLNWQSEKGLYTTFWHDFVKLVNQADQLTLDLSIPPSMLSILNFYHKFNALNLEFFIAKKDYEINVNQDELIGSVTIEVIKSN